MAQNMTTSPSHPLGYQQTTAGLPLSLVFERLKQLKAWQQQQQDTLVRQQQEQLLRLHREQCHVTSDGRQEQAGLQNHPHIMVRKWVFKPLP